MSSRQEHYNSCEEENILSVRFPALALRLWAGHEQAGIALGALLDHFEMQMRAS